jgi:chromosomal replication initiation ATPase DnaA
MSFDLAAFMARHNVDPSLDPEMAHCPHHGPYRARERLADGQLRVVQRECPKCAAQAQNAQRLQRVPRRYRQAELSTSKASAAQDWAAQAMKWCRLDTIPNLWLHGPVGTGKTHLGHALCSDFTLQGQRSEPHFRCRSDLSLF